MDRMVALATVLDRAGEPHVSYGGLHADGSPDSAASELVDFLHMANWSEFSLQELLALVRAAEAGTYQSPNERLPDWGVNDVNIWLAPPKVDPGTFCITNENTESEQHFRFQDFWEVLSCYKKLEQRTRDIGRASLVDNPIEAHCVIQCIRAL